MWVELYIEIVENKKKATNMSFEDNKVAKKINNNN